MALPPRSARIASHLLATASRSPSTSTATSRSVVRCELRLGVVPQGFGEDHITGSTRRTGVSPMRKTLKTPKRVIHCIAQCQDCDWSADGFRTAAREASQHVRQTGHVVTVEQGVTYQVLPDERTAV